MKRLSDAILVGSVSGLMLLLGTAALIIVGNMTADDLTVEQNEYCKNVYEETHPDYKNIFAKTCADWLTERNKSVN